MHRELHTPGRRFKDCRIMVRPWRVPTMIAFPPPPPDAAIARPLMALPRAKTPVEAERRVVRGPSTRRRRDCLFLPDMEVAMQIFEARRRAEEMERDAVARHVHPHRRPKQEPRRYLSPYEDPMVLGLLMLVVPPLAVTMAWSSSRLSRAAQIALTVYGALTTIVGGAVIAAALL